ncbi:MAG: RNase H-like domain-containing protein [Sedimenticola sp.]
MGQTPAARNQGPNEKSDKYNSFQTNGMDTCSAMGSSIYCDGLIEGWPVKMLVDTGSVVTLVHFDLFQQCTERVHNVEPFQETIVSANGQPLQIHGQATMGIEVGGKIFKHTVIVCKDLAHWCLLGTDFMRDHGVMIDFQKQHMIIESTTAKLQIGTGAASVCRVSVRETVVVPGGHEMIIPGKIKSKERGVRSREMSGIFEPLKKFVDRQGVLLAHAVVKSRKDEVPIRLMNLSDKDIVIYKNTNVGSLLATEPEGLSGSKAGTHGIRVCPIAHQDKVGAACSSSPDRVARDTEMLDLKTECDLGNSNLQPDQQSKLEGLIREYADTFSRGPNDLGRTDKIHHQIRTGDATPIKQTTRRVPIHKRDEVRRLVGEMSDQGIIRPSSSPWGSPIVLAQKKDGSTRFCIDFRKVNEVTKSDAYPIPRIDETLESLAGSKYFSTLDLASGYWQVELDPKDREKSAFVTPYGLYEFNVMPFGLSGAPGTFQRLMEAVLAGLQYEVCLVYLDDVIVFSANFDDHLTRLRLVFDKFREANLKMRARKCRFVRDRVTCLGHVVSAEGIATDTSKTSAVANWPQPRNVSEVRQFLGLASYYRKFVRNFAEIAAPLHKLLLKSEPFVWSESCRTAFSSLKEKLTTAPILAYPDISAEFILDTDASNESIGAVLSQVQDGMERVVSYGSRSLTKAERNYAVTRKELLAIVYFVKQFRPYLLGRQFRVRTDHGALSWLRSFKDPDGQIARWQSLLAEYDFVIIHRAGKSHTNADALSRIPENQGEESAAHITAAVAECTPNWMESLTLRQVQTEQLKDPAITSITNGIADQPVGNESETGVTWYLKEGVLYHVMGTCQQLVIPRTLVPKVLSSIHKDASGGHLGVTKCATKISDRFYWAGWRNDVEQYCRQCLECARKKDPVIPARAPLMSTQATEPLQTVAMDILGPLPESHLGNKYILVISDLFTKWTEAYPLRNHRARTVAEVVVNEFICRFGAPVNILTDQGRDFESKLFKEMCDILGVEKIRTTPYHPQCDGQVERFNRTLLQMLSKYVNESQDDWDIHIPHVMLAYRSSQNESTKYSPAFLMFGHELRIPVDIMFGSPPRPEEGERENPTRVKQNLQDAYKLVRENLQMAHQRQKDRYDQKMSGKSYEVGDHVWLHEPAVKVGRTRKLHSPWCGPFVVLKRITEVVYRIKRLGKPTKKVVHFNRLKPYVGQVERVALGPASETAHAPKRQRKHQAGSREMVVGLSNNNLHDVTYDFDIDEEGEQHAAAPEWQLGNRENNRTVIGEQHVAAPDNPRSGESDRDIGERHVAAPGNITNERPASRRCVGEQQVAAPDNVLRNRRENRTGIGERQVAAPDSLVMDERETSNEPLRVAARGGMANRQRDEGQLKECKADVQRTRTMGDHETYSRRREPDQQLNRNNPPAGAESGDEGRPQRRIRQPYWMTDYVMDDAVDEGDG